jgi:hypothetical protein
MSDKPTVDECLRWAESDGSDRDLKRKLEAAGGYICASCNAIEILAAGYHSLERERDEAREELSEWRALELWGGTPELVHQWIKGQQSRIHAAQDAEAQAERLAEALERIKQDDDQPMSLRVSSPKAIAKSALAAYRATSGEKAAR